MAGLAPVIGRDDELRRLREEFVAADAEPTVRVLVGLGGVGKTSLARTYAQRHRGDYAVVWWVRAEEPSAIDPEFRALLEILLPAGEAAQVRDARATTFALLARREDPWLLVLDNVPDAETAHDLLPGAGRGHVLITSRATGWSNPRAVLPVRPLDTEASVSVLTELSLDDDRTSAAALAEELAGLPLALTQAASFVRANAIDLATYLRWYRDRSTELHEHRRPADYPHTVATTWRLAIDRLPQPARALLNLLAFLAPDDIPLGRLLTAAANADQIELAEEIRSRIQPLLVDDVTRHRAIGELHAYSLVTPVGPHSVTVHRLVQTVTRHCLVAESAADHWADAALALLTNALPSEPANAISIATWNALYTHVHAILDHVPLDRPDIVSFRHRVANWPGHIGAAGTARDLLAELVPLHERVFGTEHPATLSTQHDLACWTGAAGDTVRARDLFAELVAVRERVSGAGHPDTLNARFQLALWTGQTGDAARARDLSAELLPVRERVSGPEHPDTLTVRSILATWTGDTGDAIQARDMLTESLRIRERVSGAEHPDTLDARVELAYWTGRAGDVVRARDLFAELVLIWQRELGAEHPNTLTARSNLAHWTGQAGDVVQARDMFAQLLPVRERVLGTDHPDTVNARRELANWTQQANTPARPDVP